MTKTIGLVVLLCAWPVTSAAQERTTCADSFSERLAAVRADFEAFSESHPAGTPWVRTPSAEDVACEVDDMQHRTSLVPHPEEPLLDALIRQEIMCYGNSRPACTRARASLRPAWARWRARAAAPPTP